jgi:hypothetical protein
MNMATNMGKTSSRQTTPWYAFILGLPAVLQHLTESVYFLGIRPFVSKREKFLTKGTYVPHAHMYIYAFIHIHNY